ncbi:MAG: hypothetical protein KDD61_17670, partial [Bdellovibrionales bacterium]|nr:hypothetical protein [Bdellovibrionales bacterium]
EERLVGEDLVGNAAANAFERIPFDEAWSFLWNTRAGNWRSNHFSLGLRYLFAPTVQGSLLSGTVRYLADSHWTAFFNFDVVGSQGHSQGEYFFRNQGNDRVQLGVTYVF